MPFTAPSSLLDLPPFPADGYADIADRMGALLGTRNDVLLVQGEAIIALEAVASSLAQPGLGAINIITSPYGGLFGGWLRRGGAYVTDVVAEAGLPVTVEAVKSALDARPEAKLLAIVHAESASGIINPLEEIVALTKARGVVTVVDAVASFGGHALDVDGLGVDLVVTGPQKSLAGSAGLSVIGISPKAWALGSHEAAPVNSVLSLLDHKRLWLETGRGVLPGMPSALEFWALRAALERFEAEGLDAAIARHHLAAEATRAGVRALGLTPWVDAAQASDLVTTVRLPDGLTVGQVLQAADAAGLSGGVGPVAEHLVRLNHTGQNAQRDVVRANIAALGRAVAGDIEAGLVAVDGVYGIAA
ncbi:aspartate aminotransferase [Devosia epidermidihirudinis]|uniref:Aspartate aminotransferase n=1 Tax=Devosia epidermidihirudinis TaxID=1293439 RepID=A0A0F5Q9H1_9HYPH|nr:aminotransferase class V-fold PLP-dependent enzyme [Devosia epidermidihirudinis]KKC36664.1 aspartate aminotransferase [Devosia epidermidihirudinis]